MTEVKIRLGNGVYGLRADGHATGSAQTCSAISGILYALAGYLVNAEREGFAKPQEHSMESGAVLLRYRGDQRVGAAFYMAAIGLMQLEKAAPQYISVKLEDGRENF